jgi:hypothetical protein
MRSIRRLSGFVGTFGGQAQVEPERQCKSLTSYGLKELPPGPTTSAPTGGQQQRLQELMTRCREARDGGGVWSTADQMKLESLVVADLAASAKRAEESAQGLGR